MSDPVLLTDVPGLPRYATGKVRDIYDLGKTLLVVTTDRISAFDVVLPTCIPGKGRVLTQLSHFWFHETAHIVPNHLAQDQTIPDKLAGPELDLNSRTLRVLRAEPVMYECVVRGYLSGSGWKDYQRTGTIAGDPLPAGLTESDRLPEPVFTPATKALSGHDENISRSTLARLVGSELAAELERLSLALYRFGAEESARRGLILADTKFEFGFRNGSLILIDEVMTPDSSRFWDGQAYRPGGPQASFDKQYVRDYLEAIGWNKQPPAPALPDAVVAGTSRRYVEALERFHGPAGEDEGPFPANRAIEASRIHVPG